MGFSSSTPKGLQDYFDFLFFLQEFASILRPCSIEPNNCNYSVTYCN